MGKRVDLGILVRSPVDSAQASKGVLAVDVHGARAADTLAARTAESQGRVHVVLDFNESIKNLVYHRRMDRKRGEWSGTTWGKGNRAV